VSDGKRNYSPRAEHADWLRFHSIDLRNDPTGNTPGDSVGVLKPWRIPVDHISPELIQKIQAKIDSKRWRSSIQSSHWAGLAVAEVMGLNVSEKEEKSRARRILQDLIKNKYLMIAEGEDEHRKPRQYVETGKVAQVGNTTCATAPPPTCL
jgi:hypothetical protein